MIFLKFYKMVVRVSWKAIYAALARKSYLSFFKFGLLHLYNFSTFVFTSI